MEGIIAAFSQMRWQDVVDILVVAFVFYQILLIVRGRRAAQMLLGLAVIIGVMFLARHLQFESLSWLTSNLLSSFLLILIILFQDDIRRGLTQIGRRPFLPSHGEAMVSVVEEVVGATGALASRRHGAIIVFERSTGLGDYLEGGREVDAKVSRELICNIFWPGSPLHDGALVIQQGRIVAAGCLLPLTTDPAVSRLFGTRHRAAIGMTEETDAVVVVVSEERGAISLAVAGEIESLMDAGELHQRLMEFFGAPRRRRRHFFSVGRETGGV